MAFYDRKYVWGSPEWERLSEVRDRRLALVSKGRCIGQAIAAYAATEDEITFTLANGWALVFTARAYVVRVNAKMFHRGNDPLALHSFHHLNAKFRN